MVVANPLSNPLSYIPAAGGDADDDIDDALPTGSADTEDSEANSFQGAGHRAMSLEAFFREVKSGSNTHRVAINMSNAIIGAGIIGMPYALRISGFGFGLLLLFLMAFITHSSISYLVSSGISLRARSFEQTALLALGVWGERAVLAAQFAFDYGAALSYLIIVGDTSTQIMELALGHSFSGLRQLCIGFVAFAFCLPLCLMRDIANLEKFSIFSVATVLLVTVMLIGKLLAASGNTPRFSELPFLPDSLDVVVSIGIFSFAFVCNDCIFLYYNTLERGSAARFRYVTTLALIGSSALTSLLGCVGLVSFGNSTKANILNNYPDDDPVATIMRAFYVITMVLTYPICFFVCRQVLHVLLQDFTREERTDVRSITQSRHIAYTLAIFLSSVGIVMKVESLGMVMSITGNVAGSALGYILPGLIALSPAVREGLCRDGNYIDGPQLADRSNISTSNVLNWLGTSAQQRGPSALVLFGIITVILGILVVCI